MADMLPPIEMDFGANGAPTVIVEEAEAADLDGVLKLAPALSDPKWVRALARVANHLAHGDDYALIVDPAEFEKKYREAYDAEDPDEEVGPGTIRLHNFGIPDFTAIHPPMMEGDKLIFFAENVFMGIPYRAEMPSGAEPDYQPVDMVE